MYLYFIYLFCYWSHVQCLICLDDYEPEDQVRVMSCRHAFHKGCVDEWLLKGRNNCPACRSTVSLSIFNALALTKRPFTFRESTQKAILHHIRSLKHIDFSHNTANIILTDVRFCSFSFLSLHSTWTPFLCYHPTAFVTLTPLVASLFCHVCKNALHFQIHT